MFFRTKSIKGTPLLQLVQSFRDEQGQPRQRVIASLGDAQLPENEERPIALAVQSRLQGEQDLFEADLSKEALNWVARIVALAARSKASAPLGTALVDGVLIDQIETEQVMEFGPELVALEAWEKLGLTPILADLGFNASSIATAKLMVANRLIEPLSEWALIDWSHRTALPEMLGLRITKTAKDRLYRTSDELLANRIVIEEKLRTREADLFSLSRKVILYDVTNSHFEGLCKKNPKAKHGRNKQKRNDCRQIAIGMAFDERGMALAHEVLEGNISDTKTLELMLDRLTVIKDGIKPVVILDAGFASEANIAMLKERGYSYIINITRGPRAKYAQEFAAGEFEELAGRSEQTKIEVKMSVDPDDEDSRLVLCRSVQRRGKEEAMISKAEERYLSDVKALQKLVSKGQLKQPALIERRIGALQKKHPKIQRFYKLRHLNGELVAARNDAAIESATSLCGDYVLKTDKRLEAAELWELYMTLLKAESGFRMLKSSLGLRPNFHQLEARVDGHIFISVLAYHLLSWVREHFQVRGDSREWSTVVRLLRTHSIVTTRLKLSCGRIIQIRKPSLPDAEQQRVYDMLGIDWRQAFPAVKSELPA